MIDNIKWYTMNDNDSNYSLYTFDTYNEHLIRFVCNIHCERNIYAPDGEIRQITLFLTTIYLFLFFCFILSVKFHNSFY